MTRDRAAPNHSGSDGERANGLVLTIDTTDGLFIASSFQRIGSWYQASSGKAQGVLAVRRGMAEVEPAVGIEPTTDGLQIHSTYFVTTT
jgi:hypothetical protein